MKYLKHSFVFIIHSLKERIAIAPLSVRVMSASLLPGLLAVLWYCAWYRPYCHSLAQYQDRYELLSRTRNALLKKVERRERLRHKEEDFMTAWSRYPWARSKWRGKLLTASLRALSVACKLSLTAYDSSFFTKKNIHFGVASCSYRIGGSFENCMLFFSTIELLGGGISCISCEYSKVADAMSCLCTFGWLERAPL